MTAGNNTTRPIPAADVDEPISVAANEFAPDRFHLNGPLVYSPLQIAAIVEAAGGLPVVKTTGAMDSLADTLRDLTWSLFFGRFHQKLPPPTWFKRKAQSIEKFSVGLAKSLEIQGNDPQTIPIEIYMFLKLFAKQQGKDTGDTKTRTREIGRAHV